MTAPYRKLPGRRRGFLRGSTLWLASDHLLAVSSLRFREEYKRFFLRDIQAIVVAHAPRFYLSTRSFTIAVLWIGLFLFERQRAAWIPAALGAAAVCLVGAWLYVCTARSCLCRIYTAVSRDELPSIHRIWTARQFLAEVEPRIREAQGAMPGNWAAALEALPDAPPAEPAQPLDSPAPRQVTAAAAIFVASLLAGVLVDLAGLRSTAPALTWLSYAVAFTQIGAVIFVFIQHHRGIVGNGMQRLAIAALGIMGAVYYARQVAAFSAFVLPETLLRQVDLGASVVLGSIGVVLLAVPRRNS